MKKNKRKTYEPGYWTIPIFLSRDGDGDYAVFMEEPYYDYEGGIWQGKGMLFYGIDEDNTKKYFKLSRHLLKGNKGITQGLLHLGFKKNRSKKQKFSGNIFNKPL